MNGLDQAAAWEARKLLRAARSASLATQIGGQPFASLVTPAAAPDGTLLLLLSALSEHTRHLAADGRCALLVTGARESANPQTAPRITVTGVAAPCADAALKARWLARHPYAAFYAGFTDFALWRLVPRAGFYVGGFAKAARLPEEALAPPPSDVAAIAAAEPGILAHCNADHAGALNELAAAQGCAGAWTMLGVDCDGFDLLQGEDVIRIAFPAPVHDGPGVRAALIALLASSRGQ